MGAAPVLAQHGGPHPTTQEHPMTDTAVSVSPAAAVLAPAEGERARFFADVITVKERRPELDVWTAEIHAGCEPPLHVHHREDELIFVLEGRITAFVDGRELDVAAGAIARLPRGLAHTYAVESGSARVLTINTPGGFAGMFAEVERAFGGAMPPAPRPEDGAVMGPVFEAHGIEMVGPNPRYA
jgi:quercetin dioxygenase-like cupin family protein